MSIKLPATGFEPGSSVPQPLPYLLVAEQMYPFA